MKKGVSTISIVVSVVFIVLVITILILMIGSDKDSSDLENSTNHNVKDNHVDDNNSDDNHENSSGMNSYSNSSDVDGSSDDSRNDDPLGSSGDDGEESEIEPENDTEEEIIIEESEVDCEDVTTVCAVTGEQIDVQAAIESASEGDTVVIPAGEYTWDDQITIDKEIQLIGSGIDKTNITNARTSATGYYYPAIEISSSIDKSYLVKGFTIIGDRDIGRAIAILIVGIGNNFRITEMKFNDFDGHVVRANGGVYGVIDNCIFTSGNEIVEVQDSGDGTDSWNVEIDEILGTSSAVYIENCSFLITDPDDTDAIDSNDGARWVFRNNIAQGLENIIDFHGHCFQENRGTRLVEIYDNDMYFDGDMYWGPMTPRGGEGVIYNNRVTTTGAPGDILLQNVRSNRSCSFTTPANCIPVDGEDTSTWEMDDRPCMDQIHNMYIWDNLMNDNPMDISVRDWSNMKDHIQLDRDYFLRAPSLEEDNLEYNPYIYPHPLTEAEFGTEICGEDAIIESCWCEGEMRAGGECNNGYWE